jgi:WhiB family redox-sensing transcriptional regulator
MRSWIGTRSRGSGHEVRSYHHDRQCAVSIDIEISPTRSSAWGLSTGDDPESWKLSAVCAQTDPEIFFPKKGDSARDAKLVCQSSCPVRAECLAYALENDERFGIWGGYSERERRKLKRGNRIRPAMPHGRNARGHGNACRCTECQQDRLQRNPNADGPDRFAHGTLARYRKGCKCEPCKGANRTYQREYQAARRAEENA